MDTKGKPSNLSDQQMFHVCAGVFEEHFGTIFVSRSEGKRFIDDLRRRAGDVAPPVRTDLPSESAAWASKKTGEVVIWVEKPRPRDHQVREGDMFPDPIPGKVNIRLGVVDDHGMVVDMELGNAPPAMADSVTTSLIDAHATALRKRESETS